MEKYIEQLVKYRSFVLRGKRYFEEGRVKIIKFESLKDGFFYVESIVNGSRRYRQEIFFKETLSHATECTCPAFENFASCKHIAAALFAIEGEKPVKNDQDTDGLLEYIEYNNEYEEEYEEGLETLDTILLEKPYANNHVLNNYETKINNLLGKNNVGIGMKTKLYIELIHNNLHYYTLKIKLGTEEYNPIYIKNPIFFLESYFEKEQNYELTPTKKINFLKTKFDDFSEEILENLMDVLVLSNAAYDRPNETSLHIFSMKKIFEILEKYQELFLLKFGRDVDNYRINKTNDVVLYTLLEENENYEMDIVYKSDKLYVNPGLLINDDTHEVTPLNFKEEKILQYFLEAKKKEEKFKVNIQKKKIIEVINEKEINIIIPNELNEKIISETLKTSLYLNIENGIYKYDLKFTYGDVEFDVFKENYDDIVVRNYDEENEIKMLLPEKRTFNLDELFDFIENEIPKFKDKGVVCFIDEKIKNLHFYVPNIEINVTSLEGGILNIDLDTKDLDLRDLAKIMKQYRLKNRYVELNNGILIDLYNKQTREQIEIIDDLKLKEKEKNIPLYNIFNILNNEQKQYFNVENALSKIKEDIFETKKVPDKISDELKKILRPYQLLGVYWLQQLSKYGLGGILADDMGLGKTLQTIAFISSLKDHKKILIVAPKTLMYNWQKEFEKFTPHLKTTIVSGAQVFRGEMIQNIKDSDILITSYPLLSRDIEFYDFEFSHMFIDEAQQIKNPNTLMAKSVKQVKAKHRFALTGTPLENNLLEVWSIFDYIMPGFLSSQNVFKNEVIKDLNEQKMKKFKKQIQPFILRRLKSVVLKELPDKIHTPVYCEMSEEQEKIYQYYFLQTKKELQQELENNGFAKSQIKILALLTRLRQICVDPNLFLENYNGGSAKLETLNELLEEAIEGGHKILLFSQFTSMLEIIGKNLKKQKIKYLYLHGQTKAHERMEMVEEFDKGEISVFLLSLKAGGTGLNLNKADIVIHFDPWWNPSVENQATDRAHRFGQKNTVQVFQLIAKNTIEEKILELKQKKQELFDNLFDNQEAMFKKISEEEIRSLFE